MQRDRRRGHRQGAAQPDPQRDDKLARRLAGAGEAPAGVCVLFLHVEVSLDRVSVEWRECETDDGGTGASAIRMMGMPSTSRACPGGRGARTRRSLIRISGSILVGRASGIR